MFEIRGVPVWRSLFFCTYKIVFHSDLEHVQKSVPHLDELLDFQFQEVGVVHFSEHYRGSYAIAVLLRQTDKLCRK